MLTAAALLFAQTSLPKAEIGYLTPPPTILEGATAAYYKNFTPGPISPDGKRFFYLIRDGMPPLSALAKPHDNLGGVQVDWQANRSRTMTTRSDVGIEVVELATRKETQIQIPPNTRVSDAKWSPDGRGIAFLVHADTWTKLFVANPETGKSKPATDRPLLVTLDTDYSWDRDGHLFAVFVPGHRGPRPSAPAVAPTPYLQETDQKGAHLVTYPSLLRTPYDETLLEYDVTGQLGEVEPSNGRLAEVGKPEMYERIDPSPHGNYVLTTTLEKPFSYLVPVSSFGDREILIDHSGKEMAEIEKRPLRDGAGMGNGPGAGARGSAQGSGSKRGLTWKPDSDELVYMTSVSANADDQGDDGAPPARRHDAVLVWKAPFTDKDTTAVYDAPATLTSFSLADHGNGLFITTGAGGGGRRGGGGRFAPPPNAQGAPNAAAQTRRISYVGGPGAKAVLVAEVRADSDETANLVVGEGGFTRVSQDSKYAYLSGEKVAKDPYAEGPRPYLDRVDLGTGTKARLYESAPDKFEVPSPAADDGSKLIVTRQSPTMVPQSYYVDTSSKAEVQLTGNRDYLPDVSQAERQYITVTRNDGFKFRVKVTLPPGAHHAPAFFWIYPAEFTSQEEYDRSKRNFNKNLFTAPTGANKAILIRLGYVVVEPDVPIVGPSGSMNDEYVPQLGDSLIATIDALDERGWIDRAHLGVGGHSYGAFSTANTLAHTPYFKCGIAGDGNYLRPLTPFSFQNERRSLWEARETYLDMSPLLYVERFSGALLMYHGLEDQNVGTNPINSERLFTALEELGKPAELVMYPYEDHGQIAKETILDQWTRFAAWLDRWLKHDGKPA